jgi:hypothetical protein
MVALIVLAAPSSCAKLTLISDILCAPRRGFLAGRHG